MKKRILVDAYFAMNLGDDLFLKVLFDRYPNVKWDLLTSSKKYKNIFRDYKNVRIIKSLSVKIIGERKINLFSKLNRFFNYFRYDALVIIGGSIFMEKQSWKSLLKSCDYLPNRFKDLGKKVFILGSNFGPFNDQLFITEHRRFFSQFDDICFRDTYSYNIFKGLVNVRKAPDVVFNLEHRGKQLEKSVGFSVIDIEKREKLSKYFHSYTEMHIELIKKYIEQGYKIKLFSFCKQEGDLKAINYIKGNLTPREKDYVEVISYEGNITDFLDSYSTCETIVGTRFHSVILAFLFKQNVIPIIYSEKTFNVLKDLKMDKNCCYIRDIKDLNINDVLSNNFKLEKIKVIKDAERQFLKLDSFVK
ncbi:polysaccharide pyruvyl transferase family protein [Virgibacillus doumboii]|uniref:polysaccharide pyruvyl transferase family protein n=1 Tax=Virgibacillus doumboii TaxID=2697503 RepID=UPI0013DEFB04|nr:polysaccharide pyruvyl transferase family protein [Virgibacillus doumboii]